MISPRDPPFNCCGDGSNDHAGLQKWLDAIPGNDMGYLPPGTYCSDSTLVVHSDTTIRGAGKHRSILKNTSSKPGSHLQNAHLVTGTEQGPRVDHDIDFEDVGFHGVAEMLIPAGSGIDFLTFCGVERFSMRRCAVAHRQLDGIVTANNWDMEIDRCEFFDLGTKLANPIPGQGQYVGGSAIFCWRPSYWSRITRNYIHDSPGGGGIWLPVIADAWPEKDPAEAWIVTGNLLRRLAEFGIAGAPRGTVIAHNVISDILLVDVSGHGVEMSGGGYIFTDNVISNCDSSGAYFFNPIDAVIRGNSITNIDRQKKGHQAIIINSWPNVGVGKLPPRNVSVNGNVGNGGISLFNYGQAAMDDMCLMCNQLGPISLAPGVKGKNFVMHDNIGALP